MEPHVTVTLARLREAAELYRQLEAARRDLAGERRRDADLQALAAEYGEDLHEAEDRARRLRSEARALEDELHGLEARLQDRRSRQTGDAGTVLALAGEIAALQRRRDAAERALLDLWQQGEATGGELAAEQAATRDVQSRLARERTEWHARAARADAAAPEIAAELEHLLRRLPRPVGSRLAQIARRHADPVADLVQGACAGCGQILPLQVAVDADREAGLVVCQGCGRYVVARSSRRTRG
jgi:uncharacterized protein